LFLAIDVRPAAAADADAVWTILEPMIRVGETYPLPRDMTRTKALAHWFSPDHEVFVADAAGATLGTYYLRANNGGGGAHVANCGYVTAPGAMGQGVGRAMCRHSIDRARARGFLAMQFNFVISTNEPAVHLWQAMGFEIVGRLPRVFQHPRLGLVDAFVMNREL
jgi:ribosomal protein S18 acetylase RimI-like enzyme